MPPRRRPRVATSSNANEGVEVKGLVDSIGNMLRGVLDRVQHPRSLKKKDVFDAGEIEFKGAKGPLDAYTWVDKMEKAFESTDLPEEKKVKMAVTFLDDLAHHWWTLASRNNCGAQNMTWEQFKTLFLDVYRKDLEFQVGDWVFLKLSPWKGVVRFGKHGKLSPRYFGPYEIIERVGSLTYRLLLPPESSRIHNVFHVSMFRKYIVDPSHVLQEQPISLTRDLTYEEEPVQILDRKLRNKTIPLVKVLWRSHQVEEATWESEEQMRQQYPYLFE
ncbi:hypothetical protein ACLB2K_038173 [Fragaria x ananassa]